MRIYESKSSRKCCFPQTFQSKDCCIGVCFASIDVFDVDKNCENNVRGFGKVDFLVEAPLNRKSHLAGMCEGSIPPLQ